VLLVNYFFLLLAKNKSNTLAYLCTFSGIFAVAGIIDSFVYHGHKAIKKMEIGKHR
jgi:hypothetical protein